MSTIFYPFICDRLDRPSGGMHTLFLNARVHPDLSKFERATFSVQQHFKPYAAALEACGYDVSPDMIKGTYDYVLALLPKGSVEARYMVAKALGALKQSGVFICAADNKAGGNRIQKMLHDFDLSGIQEASKNKARVCWGMKESLDASALEENLSAGERQAIFSGDYISQPGVFGWDKVDKGSEILLQYLPEKLKGRGADFGCGYGYLGRHILERYGSIKEFISIDADYRAMEACRINLERDAEDVRKEFLWEDLAGDFTAIKNLDFIVMNPPFHEGKKTDIGIGTSFIDNAYRTLKPRGELWMVANAHLPYEAALSEKFFSVRKEFEGQGFKVFAAVK